MESQKEQTVNFGVGRFIVEMPAAMKFSGVYSMRNRQLKEIVWPDDDTQKAASADWKARVSRIEKMEPPDGKSNALIEIKDFSHIPKWCKAVFYYGDPRSRELPGVPIKGYLDVLRHAGHTDLWITNYGKSTAREFMYMKSMQLAQAYRPPSIRFGNATVLKNKDSFYMRYGAIDLSFEYKESVDIVFREHPLDEKMKMSIHTTVVEKDDRIGLIDRMENAMMSGLAKGLEIEKVRSGKRVVAGLKGDEILQKYTENGETTLSFSWMHLGKKGSAHYPKFMIDLESSDGQLEEKTALWDAVLDSMQPAGR